jgi:hypothetical protein
MVILNFWTLVRDLSSYYLSRFQFSLLEPICKELTQRHLPLVACQVNKKIAMYAGYMNLNLIILYMNHFYVVQSRKENERKIGMMASGILKRKPPLLLDEEQLKDLAFIMFLRPLSLGPLFTLYVSQYMHIYICDFF